MNKKIIILISLFTIFCLLSTVSAENIETNDNSTINDGVYHQDTQQTKHSDHKNEKTAEKLSNSIESTSKLSNNKLNENEDAIKVDSVVTTSNSGNLLAIENNEITVTLTNDITIGKYNITLSIDNDTKIQTVDDNENTSIPLIFDYVTQTNGTKNVQVNIEYLNGTTSTLYTGTLTAYYNGYMGNSFVGRDNITTQRTYMGFNTINIYANSTYHGTAWTTTGTFIETYNATELGITDSDKIVEVLYYQPYNWGRTLNLALSVNNINVTSIANYSDSKGFASYNYPSGLIVYNITSQFKANDTNQLQFTSLENNYESLYGGYLVIIYNNNTERSLILISEGSDLLNPESSGFGANSSNTISYTKYNDLIISNLNKSTLYSISANADKEDASKIAINNNTIGTLNDNYNSTTQVSISSIDITDKLQENNLIEQASIEDNLFVMGNILVINYNSGVTVRNVTVTSNSGNLLAIENNKITVNVNNDPSIAKYNITLSIGNDTYTQAVDDDKNLSIPLVFDYVTQNNGTKDVQILVDYLNGTTSTLYTGTLTAYYNGYMGNSFIGRDNITTQRTYAGFNTINIYANSTYHGTAWTTNGSFIENYDATELGITDSGKIVEVLYYQPYNWGRTLNLALSVNNINVTSIANYSDSKGFASYNYPSGLIVYNITSQFKANDTNQLQFTSLENNYEALYGGYLVIIYNNNTNYSTIIFNEGTDLLNPESSGFGANSSNTISYANINNISMSNLKNATLYVISANSDKKNASTISINNNTIGTLNDKYNTTTQVSINDYIVTDYINTTNLVTLQSLSDNLVTYSSILMVTNKLNTSISVDNVTGVVGEDITLVARVVDENGNNVTSGRVQFKINGVTLRDANGSVIYVNVTNGVARLTLTAVRGWTNTGAYISANYAGNSVYLTSTSKNSSVSIAKRNATVEIINDTRIYKAGDTITITAIVTDSNGQLAMSGQVVFKLNGVTLKDRNGKTIMVNVVNGIATLTYTLPSTFADYNYTITVIFAGGDYNRQVSKNSTLEVVKTSIHMDLDSVITTTNTAVVRAKIYDGDNKQITGTTRVTIKLNGVTIINSQNITNGNLQFTINTPYPTGLYNMTIIAGPNSVYEQLQRNTTLVIMKN